MGRRRQRSGRKLRRRDDAEKAVEQLSTILGASVVSNEEIADSAARQLMGIGRRHGVRAKPRVTRMICRACHRSLLPGKSARVRIASGAVITTCLRCKRVQRAGRDFKEGY
jgi:ribonuclease P protein subunit RPR2